MGAPAGGRKVIPVFASGDARVGLLRGAWIRIHGLADGHPHTSSLMRPRIEGSGVGEVRSAGTHGGGPHSAVYRLLSPRLPVYLAGLSSGRGPPDLLFGLDQ